MESDKRKNHISWDEYFMGAALLSAQRSKDPSSQVGACIVDSLDRIVGLGYNGFPKGCSDDEFPWSRSEHFCESKYTYVAHAELNAILNATTPLKGCRIYVTLFPCNECAKLIRQAEMSEVIYLSDKYHDDEKTAAARRILESSEGRYPRILYRRFETNRDREKLILNFVPPELEQKD